MDNHASTDLHDRFSRLHDPDTQVALNEAATVQATARAAGKRVVAVSACLLGELVRPDGGHKHAPAAITPLLTAPDVVVLPICPEILARMGVPRPTVQFTAGDGHSLLQGRGGRIVDSEGQERTAAMVQGARLAELLCETAGAEAAMLKERSPSCGSAQIHGPGGLQPGSGVFAARLMQRGMPIGSEVQPPPVPPHP